MPATQTEDVYHIKLLLSKITSRNIIALLVTFTVMIVVLQMAFNAEKFLVIVADNTEWVITGAFIFGALIAKWSDIIQFFFRKKEEESDS